ncbi:uncharacterized protein LOC121736487 [Aricia agestis]|uniref:uncharacterized protein LOC121736487 n=1 Tax=Aricia agestis TaxID=91739 RepID=UPI001C20B186|nr:uncharacterized protein LOC121736487 [Aricia agestis]
MRRNQQLMYRPRDCTFLVCSCFEEPYIRNKKLSPCQKSPLTLYELASKVVNQLPFPNAFHWSESDVARWMEKECGLSLYKECITKNIVNGRRLLFLEDASKMPKMNVTNFEHIKIITAKVRELFGVEMIRFTRSLGLPYRKPLTHCTWFKSQTGPSMGVRTLWNRCDILRWMNKIGPEPTVLDHWDMVWYQKPDFPCTKFARVEKKRKTQSSPDERCNEYQVPRKFIFQRNIPSDKQFIWMERLFELEKEIKAPKQNETKDNREILNGMSTKQFMLAKRRASKPKFFQ